MRHAAAGEPTLVRLRFPSTTGGESLESERTTEPSSHRDTEGRGQTSPSATTGTAPPPPEQLPRFCRSGRLGSKRRTPRLTHTPRNVRELPVSAGHCPGGRGLDQGVWFCAVWVRAREGRATVMDEGRDTRPADPQAREARHAVETARLAGRAARRRLQREYPHLVPVREAAGVAGERGRHP